MNLRILAAASAACTLGAAHLLAASITVSPSTNATALANALVSGTSGITINSATLLSGSTSAGTFANAAAPLPFSSGVFLTSGVASCIPGPNGSSSCGGTASGSSTSAIAGSTDSTVLTINFTPTSNVISFQYVFGSEEYLEYVGSSFNDSFKFLLNGINIAIIPGTSTPVEINLVNNTSNSSYFAVNAGPELQYDGLVGTTINLFATGAVNPGVMNTMILAISDRGDSILDSGVFLKAGSFIDAPPPTGGGDVPEPATFALVGAGLAAIRLYRRR